jgi:hypothetical protein
MVIRAFLFKNPCHVIFWRKNFHIYWLLFITNLHQVQWAQNHSFQPLENDKQNPYAISNIVAFCNCFNRKGSQVTKCNVVHLWTCAQRACLHGWGACERRFNFIKGNFKTISLKAN